MLIHVQSDRSYPRPSGPRQLILVPDSWNDFGFTITYDLWIWDPEEMLTEIGAVKIALGQLREQQRPLVGNRVYENLPDGSYSLGQGEEYYAALKNLETIFGYGIRVEILTAMNDVAYDLPLLEEVRKYEVTKISLLRSYSVRTVRTQFNRIANGGEILARYSFKYVYPDANPFSDSAELKFDVDPESRPPSNVHVVIGRNGAGKTTLLQRMARCLLEPDDSSLGAMVDLNNPGSKPIANLVSVAFSAFDPFKPIDQADTGSQISYKYVGLRGSDSDPNEEFSGAKSTPELAKEFVSSLWEVAAADLVSDWSRAVAYLENDANFREYDVNSLFSSTASQPDGNLSPDKAVVTSGRGEISIALDVATDKFKRMSSGHKIVLFTLSKLVSLVREQTLVLIDEPESHLHPPLLAAFLRALSDLLDSRNGVAVVATHSPVVLQEVPASCVSILQKFGTIHTVKRPEIETFGETVGVLTHSVFDLEVHGSGFYREIARAVEDYSTYDEVINSFGGRVGGEGRALARVLLNSKNNALLSD